MTIPAYTKGNINTIFHYGDWKQGHMVKFHEAVQSNAAVSLACLFQKILTNFHKSRIKKGWIYNLKSR